MRNFEPNRYLVENIILNKFINYKNVHIIQIIETGIRTLSGL